MARSWSGWTLSGGGLTARVLTFGSVIQDLRLAATRRRWCWASKALRPISSIPLFRRHAGRVANRVAEGRFTLDGRAYQLECNEGGVTHLHGGSDGLAVRNWSIIDLAVTGW